MKLKKGKALDIKAKKQVSKKKKRNVAAVTNDGFANVDSEEMQVSDAEEVKIEKQQKSEKVAKKTKIKSEKLVEKKQKSTKVKKKKEKESDLGAVTTDDFFNQDFENMNLSDSGNEREEADKQQQNPQKVLKNKKQKSSKLVNGKEKNKKPAQATKSSEKKPESADIDSDSGESNLDPVEHRKSLMKLKDTDPEFFKFLKQNDTKLLDFNVSDEEGDNPSDDDDDDDLKHIPDAADLEIGSDESDYEPVGSTNITSTRGPTKVTLKLIKSWQEEIQTDKTSKTIKSVVEAFHAALETVSDAETQTTQFRVEGGAIFNGIVQLCILQLPDAFKTFLHLNNEVRLAHKAKKFPKIKGVLKSYLSDLIKVFQNVSSVNIITTLLKHLHQMIPFTQSFSSLRKPLLRILLKYWSTGEEETVRVVAFLCIVKIATSQTSIINGLLKTMYIKYVENSKFVSPTTLPAINFMRRSLVEMYLLDSNFSYQNAFLYVRQLAIHLRNALTLKKKEHFQAVYNWQYINSLRFWSELIPLSKKQSLLRNLVYPLVQITIGVIKLIPSAQYYPLRFHCVKMLINISRESNTFIPSLPFLVEILDTYDFNRKHKAVSMKPISLMCILRVSKGQAQENGYKDAILENVFELILESAAKDSHTVYFPDMYVPCIIKLKTFLQKCNVAMYCRKMKHLLDKIEEGRKFIETERSKHVFNLADMNQIEAWETKIKSAGTPVSKYYDSWLKVHQVQKLKLLTQNDESAQDFKVPSIKKKSKRNRQNDSDEDSDLEIPVEEMERRLNKQKGKKAKKAKKVDEAEDMDIPTDNNDVVQDIKASDW